MSGILQHSGAPKGHIHGAVNWEFSTYDTMLDYTVLTAKDIHKVAYVVNTGGGESGYFILDSINTITGEPTWVSIFGGAGVGSTNLAIGTVTATTVQVTSDTGTDATLPAATNTTAGVATATQIVKLESMATNAELRDRATHNGTQTVSTLSDFNENVQDLIASTLVAGSNVTLTYDDTAGTLTVASSGGSGGGVTPDAVRATRTTNIATAVGWNKVVLQAETYDTGNICDLGTSRITPVSAGYYLVNARVQITASATNVTAVYKNGARVGEVGTEGSSVGTGGSCLVYCNGTTDYIELYVYTAAIATINSNAELTYIEVIGPINATGGGGGGGATNLAATLSPTNIIVTSDTGTDATLPAADGTNAGLMVPAQFTKLAGIATAATANDTDVNLKNRDNHTGTQLASTISDFTEASQDATAALLVAGTNVTLTYNDAGNTLTIAASGGGGVSDGDKGDVTVSASGATWTIDNDVVTFAKMQNIATNKLLGRGTASSGDIEEITLGTNLTLTAGVLNASGGGGGLSDGDYGDIVVSGSSTVLTVDSGVISPAKLTTGAPVWNSDGALTLLELSAVPSTPSAGSYTLYAQKLAEKFIPAFVDSTGLVNSLQSMLAYGNISFITAIAGTTTLPLGFGTAGLTYGGSATAARTISNTSYYTRQRRIGAVSVTSVGNSSSFRDAQRTFAVGNGSGLGGFFTVMVFGCSDAATVSGARQFCGLSSSSSALALTSDPSSLTNVIGVGNNAADSNLRIMFGGSSAQTSIDLGSNFPANTLSTDMYELTLYAPPSSDNTVYYQVVRLNTGHVATGTLTGTAGVALPASSTMLAHQYVRGNNATALAVAIDFSLQYTHTF